MLEEKDGHLVAAYDWRTSANEPLTSEVATTYTGDPTPLSSRTACEWNRPLGDIVSALIDAGLQVVRISEYEELPYKHFPMMVEVGHRMFRLPKNQPRTPLSISIEAYKS